MTLLAETWMAVAGDAAEAAGVADPAAVTVTGAPGHLPAHFPVEDAAVATVAAALVAAAALHADRGGPRLDVRVDRGQVAAAVRSERLFATGPAAPGPGRESRTLFAPLSRFWRSRDGWVRTHANYPWHRKALLDVVGTRDDPGLVAAALAERTGEEIEAQVFGAGGVAAAVRTSAAWLAHPQGAAVAAEPLVATERLGDSPARRRPAGGGPAAGVHIVDLTRVIAGPVATRYLGALGADVLRLDPPDHPDLARDRPADGLLAKRSALLDLGAAGGRARLDGLLAAADVVVCGYRPGALDRFGLAPEDLAARHPGLVVVLLDAWGHTGPWRLRRGFDSIVQAACGIADAEAGDDGTPGALPCQLLDHGTGYLAAAAVLDGLRRQARHGGTVVRRLSLARTAAWLLSQPDPSRTAGPGATPADDPAPWLVELPAPRGPVTAVAPPGRWAADRWRGPPARPATVPTPPPGPPPGHRAPPTGPHRRAGAPTGRVRRMSGVPDPCAGAGGVVVQAGRAGWATMSADVDPTLRHGLAELSAGRHVVAETAWVLRAGGRRAMLVATSQAPAAQEAAGSSALAVDVDVAIDRKGTDVTCLRMVR